MRKVIEKVGFLFSIDGCKIGSRTILGCEGAHFQEVLKKGKARGGQRESGERKKIIFLEH